MNPNTIRDALAQQIGGHDGEPGASRAAQLGLYSIVQFDSNETISFTDVWAPGGIAVVTQLRLSIIVRQEAGEAADRVHNIGLAVSTDGASDLSILDRLAADTTLDGVVRKVNVTGVSIFEGDSDDPDPVGVISVTVTP